MGKTLSQKNQWLVLLMLLFVLSLSLTIAIRPAYAIECTFLNPLIKLGQDPSVVYQDGYYYLVQSTGGMLTITKAETLTGLSNVIPTPVFIPPSGEDYSYDMWAPELAYLQDKWYIYVAATSAPGANATHRMFVLEADTDDPMGSWTMRGKVYDPAADQWAIDGVVFEYNAQLYMVWSGWETEQGDFPQNLYIAEMSDPLTLSGPRHLLSEPDQPWEQTVAALQEGPQVFLHNGQLSIVYSADASWMPAYKLGLLKLTGDDLLDQASWTKIGPIFEQTTDSGTPVYGPGHNANPVVSPDGEEYWLIYHAKTRREPGWDDRAIFAQRFTWAEDNTPVFEAPIPAEMAQAVPSGEPCGLAATLDSVEIPPASDDGSFFNAGEPLVNTAGNFSIAAEVQLQMLEGNYAFVSQGGGISSNFVLGYQEGQFAFTMFNNMGENSVAVTADLTPEVNTWYHLIGIYNAASQQMSLYLDGELQGTASFTEPWNALGNTLVGAARRKGQWVDFMQDSQVRQIQLYNGALEEDDIQSLLQD